MTSKQATEKISQLQTKGIEIYFNHRYIRIELIINEI